MTDMYAQQEHDAARVLPTPKGLKGSLMTAEKDSDRVLVTF